MYLHEIKIGDTDILDYVVDFDVYRSRDSDDLNPSKILISKAIGSLGILKFNATITIKRGISTATKQFIFKGIITDIVDNANNGVFECTIRPPNWNLSTQFIVQTFDSGSTEAGVITSIWETIAKGEDEDINVSAQSDSTLPSLTFFLCKGESRWERAQYLKNLIKYQSYYKPSDDTYHLEPEGFTDISGSFNVGKEILNLPNWAYDFENIINQIKVLGAVDRARFQESFTGDDSNKDFTLTYVPEDTEVYIPSVSQANLQVLGIENSTETYAYTVDRENQKISFVVAPSVGADNVIVNYSYVQQRPVIQRNSISIDKYGKREKIIKYDTIVSVDDARTQSDAILSVYANPFRSTILQIRTTTDYFPGNRMSIVDSISDESVTLTINKIHFKYINEFDIVEVGDKNYKVKDLFYDIIAQIDKLNSNGTDNQEILTDVLSNDINISISRVFELYSASPDADTLYWDDDNQGEWDNFNWADDTVETRTLVKRVPNKDYFYEDFTTTDYTDTANTTATVNTTNGRVEF